MNSIQKTKVLCFRKAKVQDAPAISALVNSAYRGDASRVGWTTEADLLSGQRTDREAIEELIHGHDQCLLIGELEERIVGTVHLQKVNEQTCYFGMFAIEPRLQGRGIGKDFVHESEKLAIQEWNCAFMEMTVITVREELIHWYERRGYQATGEIRPFPYGNERFGIPLRPDLKLGVLRKRLIL